MALDERYVVGINLGEYFVDKDTGQPLAEGTIEFYKDTSRAEGKLVYQLSGSTPNYGYTALPNPITLSGVGTVQNAGGDNVAVYYYPYDENGELELYYIVVKSAGDIEQFTREAWPNITAETDPVEDTAGKVTNELGNPQFVDVYFNPAAAHTFTTTATSETFSIAPDWDLVVTGTISSTISVQRNYLAGNLGAPSDPSGVEIVNPPYDLKVTPSGGISSIKLRQRLNHNPGLFSGGYISGYLIAKSDTNNNVTVALEYQESDGSSAVEIASAQVSNTAYTEIRNSVNFPASTNANTSESGYLDILVSLPVNESIRVSSVQVVGMDQDSSPAQYDQEPVNRQEDHTWHNYKNSVIIQPKDTVLSGWEFATNPYQFRDVSAALVTSQCQYIYDQTILYQQSGGSTVNAGLYTGVNGVNRSLGIQAASATNQFALIQYVDYATARSYMYQNMSSVVKLRLDTSHGTNVRFKMRLIYRSDAPPTLSASEPISSWSSGGDPSFSAGWESIEPAIDQVYTLENSTTFVEYSFNKMFLPSAPASTPYFGVVLYTIDDMDQSGTPDIIYFDSITLVPNDFAVGSTPKTFDQSLQECQYYYEKSYGIGTLPGSNETLCAVVRNQNASTNGAQIRAYPTAFDVQFKNEKNKTPTMTWYTVAGTSGSVLGTTRRGSGGGTTSANVLISEWTVTPSIVNVSAVPASSTGYAVNGATSDPADSGWITFHYTADARLGI